MTKTLRLFICLCTVTFASWANIFFFSLEVDIWNTYFPNVNNKMDLSKSGGERKRKWDFKEFNCSTGLLPTLAFGCSVVGGVISGTQSVWARPRCFVTRSIVQTVALQSAVFTVIICITIVGNWKPEERGKIVKRLFQDEKFGRIKCQIHDQSNDTSTWIMKHRNPWNYFQNFDNHVYSIGRHVRVCTCIHF